YWLSLYNLYNYRKIRLLSRRNQFDSNYLFSLEYFVSAFINNLNSLLLCQSKKSIKYAFRMIVINSLSKKYGTKSVLKNVTINLEKGKIYGVVGKNGAGKTTLFKCISELEKYSGQIKSEFNPLKNHLGLLQT